LHPTITAGYTDTTNRDIVSSNISIHGEGKEMEKISLPDAWDVLVIRWCEKQQRIVHRENKFIAKLQKINQPK